MDNKTLEQNYYKDQNKLYPLSQHQQVYNLINANSIQQSFKNLISEAEKILQRQQIQDFQRDIFFHLRIEQNVPQRFDDYMNKEKIFKSDQIQSRDSYSIETDNIHECTIIPIIVFFIDQYQKSFLAPNHFGFNLMVKDVIDYINNEIELLAKQKLPTLSFKLSYDAQEIIDFCTLMEITLSNDIIQFNSFSRTFWGSFFWRTLAKIISEKIGNVIFTSEQYVYNLIQRYQISINYFNLAYCHQSINSMNWSIIYEDFPPIKSQKYQNIYEVTFLIVRTKISVFDKSKYCEQIYDHRIYQQKNNLLYLLTLNQEGILENNILTHNEEIHLKPYLNEGYRIIKFQSVLDAMFFSYSKSMKLVEKVEKTLSKEYSKLEKFGDECGVNLKKLIDKNQNLNQKNQSVEADRLLSLSKPLNFKLFQIAFQYLLTKNSKAKDIQKMIKEVQNQNQMLVSQINSLICSQFSFLNSSFIYDTDCLKLQSFDIMIWSANYIYMVDTQNKWENHNLFGQIIQNYEENKQEISNICSDISYSIQLKEIKKLSDFNISALNVDQSQNIDLDYDCFEFYDLSTTLNFIVSHLYYFKQLDLKYEDKTLEFMKQVVQLPKNIIKQIINKCEQDQNILLSGNNRIPLVGLFLYSLKIFEGLKINSLKDINTSISIDDQINKLKLLNPKYVQAFKGRTLNYNDIKMNESKIIILISLLENQECFHYKIIFKKQKYNLKTRINLGYNITYNNNKQKGIINEVSELECINSITFLTQPSKQNKRKEYPEKKSEKICSQCKIIETEVFFENFNYCSSCFEEKLFT